MDGKSGILSQEELQQAFPAVLYNLKALQKYTVLKQALTDRGGLLGMKSGICNLKSHAVGDTDNTDNSSSNIDYEEDLVTMLCN